MDLSRRSFMGALAALPGLKFLDTKKWALEFEEEPVTHEILDSAADYQMMSPLAACTAIERLEYVRSEHVERYREEPIRYRVSMEFLMQYRSEVLSAWGFEDARDAGYQSYTFYGAPVVYDKAAHPMFPEADPVKPYSVPRFRNAFDNETHPMTAREMSQDLDRFTLNMVMPNRKQR